MSQAQREGGKLRKVGVLWRPRTGSQSKGAGSITINGVRQKFVILVNDRKTRDTDPDYRLMSSEEPEPDPYERERQSGGREPATDDVEF